MEAGFWAGSWRNQWRLEAAPSPLSRRRASLSGRRARFSRAAPRAHPLRRSGQSRRPPRKAPGLPARPRRRLPKVSSSPKRSYPIRLPRPRPATRPRRPRRRRHVARRERPEVTARRAPRPDAGASAGRTAHRGPEAAAAIVPRFCSRDPAGASDAAAGSQPVAPAPVAPTPRTEPRETRERWSRLRRPRRLRRSSSISWSRRTPSSACRWRRR